MLRSFGRVATLALTTAALLLVVTYVYLGTRLLPDVTLLGVVAPAVVVPAVAVLWPLDTRTGPVFGVLLLGTVVYTFGIYGTGTSCIGQVAGASAYGVAYDGGVLNYGAHLGGANYECSAATVPGVVVAGYLLVTIGFVAAAFDWHLDPPWNGLSVRRGRFGSE
ncbi:hypothetical protein [Halomarina rubra]|uniref:Uncharacterized protein n=1 Tax=Halomarina rubra TaxID=2071873 RepID=A0ABD6AS70_9EURY|nr:hypothetical protein [Halomarina rubra]